MKIGGKPIEIPPPPQKKRVSDISHGRWGTTAPNTYGGGLSWNWGGVKKSFIEGRQKGSFVNCGFGERALVLGFCVQDCLRSQFFSARAPFQGKRS